MREPAGRIVAAIGWAWLAVMAVLLVRSYVVQLWNYVPSDLAPIYLAGQLVRGGERAHLYDHDAAFFNQLHSDAWERAAAAADYHVELRPFVQLPVVAFAAQAMLPFSLTTLGRVLLVANLLAIAVALVLLDRLFDLGLRCPWRAGTVLALLYFFEPMRASFELGQTAPLVLLALVLALFLDRRDRQVGAGLLLAGACVFKLAPGLLVVDFIVRRRGRALYAFAAGMGGALLTGLALVGIDTHVAFAHRMIDLSRQGFAAFNNQSIASFLLRFELPFQSVFEWRLYHLSPAIRIATLVVLAGGIAGAWECWRRAPAGGRDDILYALLLVLMLLVPTVSWNHYYLYLLIAAAIAWKRRASGTSITVATLTAGGLFLMTTFFGLGHAMFLHGNMFVSAYLIGALLIAAALVSGALSPGHGTA